MSNFLIIIIIFNNIVKILYLNIDKIRNFSFFCVFRRREFLNKVAIQFERIDVISFLQVISIIIVNNSLLNDFHN